jgi:hypothetical protein
MVLKCAPNMVQSKATNRMAIIVVTGEVTGKEAVALVDLNLLNMGQQQ